MDKKRILFVDDDPLLLLAMKRLFRRNRENWEVEFAENAGAALALLEQHRFDVVVTDMYMPGLTGDAFLAVVVEKYPATARIVLSGHAAPDKAAVAARLAHQCLAKPCDFETLSETISALLMVQDVVRNPHIRECMGHIGNLPSLPRIFQALNEILQSEHCDYRSVADIVAKDIAMSAKLLQLVNSSFFGLGRRVSSMTEAVRLLGIGQIRALLLGSYVFEAFSGQANSAYRPLVEQLWRRSLQVAELAQAIAMAEAQTEDRPDQAYMGGLLHGIGILIFLAHCPDACNRLVTAVKTQPLPLLRLEQDVLGITHAEAGAYILGLWGLPHRIVEAVLMHPTPSRLEYDGFCATSAVHVASALLSDVDEPGLGIWHTELDSAYLERIHRTEQVDRWRGIANVIASRTSR